MTAHTGTNTNARSWRLWLLLGLTAIFSACSTGPETPYPGPAATDPSAAEQATIPHSAAVIPGDARILEINPELSRITIKVYPDGSLAHLGHNHVVSAHGVSGRVWTHQKFAHSGFELSIPVAHMVVDDPADRAAAGDDFSRPVSSHDAAATRANLLGERVLDAARFPALDISAGAISGVTPNFQATLLVTLKGATSKLTSPVQITVSEHQLVASGTFQVLQTSLNITPYSALAGALRVRDELDIEYRIVAERQAE